MAKFSALLFLLVFAVGALIGFIATRRWRLPTPTAIADAVKVLGGTGSVVVLAGVVGFFGVLAVVGLGAIVSMIRELWTGNPLVVSDFWDSSLEKVMWFVSGAMGIGLGGKVGHRATTKPALVREEAEAEAKKVLAEAKAEVVRRTGEMPADGRTTPLDDPARGLSDDGEPL